MSCFLRERNTVEGMNPVKVYIMNNKKHVAKYDGEVKVSHSVFNTLHPIFQASILKRKADRERLKEEKEQKHETPAPKPSKGERFSALANIHGFQPVGQYLSKELGAVSAISPEMTKKIKELPKSPEMTSDTALRKELNRIKTEVLRNEFILRELPLYERRSEETKKINDEIDEYMKKVDSLWTNWLGNKIERDKAFKSTIENSPQWSDLGRWLPREKREEIRQKQEAYRKRPIEDPFKR